MIWKVIYFKYKASNIKFIYLNSTIPTSEIYKGVEMTLHKTRNELRAAETFHWRRNFLTQNRRPVDLSSPLS